MFEILVSALITYTNDAKPIFQNKCSMCHNYMPDKNWLDYDIAYSKRKQLYQRVVKEKSMPPPGYLLLDEERDIIRKWLDQGAKK